jgi:membrane protein
MISRAIRFLRSDLWRIRAKDLTGSRFFLIRILRIIVLSFRGIWEDRCYMRATALTFYSLLSIVPVAALLFGIAKGFGFQKALEQHLLERMEGQEEVVARIIAFSQALLENTKGGVIAGFGMILLFWAVIRLLGNIEGAFNDVWGVRKARSLGRKVTDYLSIMLIGPVLFVISSTATVVIHSQVESLIRKISLLGALAPAIFFLLQWLPYGTLWVLFTFMYLYMPNTRVNFRSGVLGGVIAGSIYHAFQWFYIHAQVGVSQYNAIYGSFAALPLFLMWLQFSWVIVLFGAEISFAHQNVDTYEFEPDCLKVSRRFKNLLSLRIVQILVKHFIIGDNSWDENRLARRLEAPIRLVRQVLSELVQAGIVSRIKTDDDRVEVFQPSLHPDKITIGRVLRTLERTGTDTVPLEDSDELKTLKASLDEFAERVETSPGNLRLRDI